MWKALKNLQIACSQQIKLLFHNNTIELMFYDKGFVRVFNVNLKLTLIIFTETIFLYVWKSCNTNYYCHIYVTYGEKHVQVHVMNKYTPPMEIREEGEKTHKPSATEGLV